MEPHQKSSDFAWTNYAPQHQPLIVLRFEQARRLHACTLCGLYPIMDRRALVHVALRSVGAHTLDARPLVKAVALCLAHSGLTDDELADHVWPHWR